MNRHRHPSILEISPCTSKKIAALALWAGLGCFAVLLPASLEAQTIRQEQAHIGFLDKITGRIQNHKVPVGDSISFGNLTLWVRACYRSAPGERNESTAFFEIFDHKQRKNYACFFRLDVCLYSFFIFS